MTNVISNVTATALPIPSIQFLNRPVKGVVVIMQGEDGRDLYLVGNAASVPTNALPATPSYSPIGATPVTATIIPEAPIVVPPTVKPAVSTPTAPTVKPTVVPPTPAPTGLTKEQMIAEIKSLGGEARGLHLCKPEKLAEKLAAARASKPSATPTPSVTTTPTPTPTPSVTTTPTPTGTKPPFKGRGGKDNNEIHPRPEWKAVVITQKGQGKEKTVFILQDSPEKMRVINPDGVDQTGVAAGYIRGFVWSVEKRHVKEVFHA
jgi:hypothetical protein